MAMTEVKSISRHFCEVDGSVVTQRSAQWPWSVCPTEITLFLVFFGGMDFGSRPASTMNLYVWIASAPLPTSRFRLRVSSSLHCFRSSLSLRC